MHEQGPDYFPTQPQFGNIGLRSEQCLFTFFSIVSLSVTHIVTCAKIIGEKKTVTQISKMHNQ